MKILITLSLLFVCTSMSAQTENEILSTLDEVIENKHTYRQSRLNTIDSLKTISRYARGGQLASIYQTLFKQYTQYQSDSAMHYLMRLGELDIVRGDQNLYIHYLLNKATTYGVMGQYSEAATIIESMDVRDATDDIRSDFYHTARTIYGWKSEYMKHAAISANTCRAKTQLYRDSILMYDHNDLTRNVTLADNYICNGHPDSAIYILEHYSDCSDELQRAYILLNMSEAYRLMGNTNEQIRYLALTSIHDIKRGITEYMALPLLAKLLNDRGDTERAYNYLFCSLEDANFCNARLRTIEASEMFPIIDKSHKNVLMMQNQFYGWLSIGCFISALLLVLGIIFLRREMRKLSLTRSQLADANAELHKMNENLEETNKIKEEYITLYLNRCRDSIDAFDKYRRTLLKLAKNGQKDELLKQLKSAEPIKEEHKQFYDEFDESFLGLHPNFVQHFNALLQPQAQIVPKKGEKLTPELRIYALIRLGITGIQDIAHFLDYSLPTIYNYRSKIHNAALGSKDDFDNSVMNLP